MGCKGKEVIIIGKRWRWRLITSARTEVDRLGIFSVQTISFDSFNYMYVYCVGDGQSDIIRGYQEL